MLEVISRARDPFERSECWLGNRLDANTIFIAYAKRIPTPNRLFEI